MPDVVVTVPTGLWEAWPNALEARFYGYLDELRAQGHVAAWAPQHPVIPLARPLRSYTPDACVRLAAGQPFAFASCWGPGLVLVEVKPEKRGGGVLWLGDSRAKVALVSQRPEVRALYLALVVASPRGDGWAYEVM